MYSHARPSSSRGALATMYLFVCLTQYCASAPRSAIAARAGVARAGQLFDGFGHVRFGSIADDFRIHFDDCC